MKKKLDYNLTLKTYIIFLKKNNLYDHKKIFFYENNIEKLKNWTNLDFRKNVEWYKKIKKNNKAVVQNVHLEKMKKWNYDKKKGTISHDSGEFFCIEGKRISKTKRNRELKREK